MPNPKRRHSAARRGNRRAHDKLKQPALSECPNCHEQKLPHRACPHCGGGEDAAAAVDETLQRAVQSSIDEVERHSRRIFEIAGMPGGETLSPE